MAKKDDSDRFHGQGEREVTHMLGVDELIADALTTADEARRAAVEQEQSAEKGKKKEAQEVVARVEELEIFFAGLSADDAFVLEAAYLSVFTAAEGLAGIARPEKIDETIEALKKTGDALRKLAKVEQKPEKLIEKMEKLKKAHDKLFEQVQTVTAEALDMVKRKYKGEETDLEKRFKMLRESPLVCGIEKGADTPEAREKALKQEIEELLLRSSVEGRLKPMEKKLADMKERLAKMQRGYQEMKQRWNTQNTRTENQEHEKRQFLTESGFFNDDEIEIAVRNFDFYVIESERKVKEQIKSLEQVIARDHLAFEHNRGILEEVLRDEHSAKELSDAFVGLRTLLDGFRKAMSGETWGRQDWDKVLSDPTNKLASKILGYFQQYGADFDVSGYDVYIEAWTRAEQILGRKVGTEKEDIFNGKEAFGRLGRIAFLNSRYPGISRLINAHKDVTPDSLASGYDQFRGPAKPIPTEEMVKVFYSGEGRLINRRRAFERVDAGLQTKPKPFEALPKSLATAGWKESRVGAFVEPGQKMALVDREYSALIERLSRPQVEAERAFDLRSPEGEFHVYTLAQAIDLLHRARRDAADVVKGIDQRDALANAEKRDLDKRVNDLENEVARLITKSEAETAASKASEADLAKRFKEANRVILEEKNRGTKKEKEDQARMDAILDELRKALEVKPGFFGSDKNLRTVLEAIVAQNDRGTND